MTTHLEYLLDGGDWACAWGEQETLAQVCHCLAPLLAEPLRVQAERIEELVRSDYGEAVRMWARLSHRLRYGAVGSRPFWPSSAGDPGR